MPWWAWVFVGWVAFLGVVLLFMREVGDAGRRYDEVMERYAWTQRKKQRNLRQRS